QHRNLLLQVGDSLVDSAHPYVRSRLDQPVDPHPSRERSGLHPVNAYVTAPYAWPSCSGRQDLCPELPLACLGGALQCPTEGPAFDEGCVINWAQVASCDGTATNHDCRETTRSYKLFDCTSNQGTQDTCAGIADPELWFGGGTGAPPGPGPAGSGGSCQIPQQPYKHCSDAYPWIIYKNQGAGHFATTPKIIYQPVPLEPDSGDSSIQGTYATTDQAAVDVDGDGIPDVARIGYDPATTGFEYWSVFANDGTGKLTGKSVSAPGNAAATSYLWPMNSPLQQGQPLAWTWNKADVTRPPDATTGILKNGVFGLSTWHLDDLNGDGLLDHWRVENPLSLNGSIDAISPSIVYVNTGSGMRSFSPNVPPEFVVSREHQPMTLFRTLDFTGDGSSQCNDLTKYAHGFPRRGRRWAMQRLLDLDADGIEDSIGTFEGSTCSSGNCSVWTGGLENLECARYNIPGFPAPQSSFNGGGQFMPSWHSLSTGSLAPAPLFDALRDYMIARTTGSGSAAELNDVLGTVYPTVNTGFTWEHKAGMIDLDGDGIPEAVSFEGGTSNGTRYRVPINGAPPRLMTTIDNGRGLTTSVTYASMHDAAVISDASVVCDGTEPECHRKMTPRTGWVVSSIASTDRFNLGGAALTSTTSYEYRYPRNVPDETGKYAFRGFDEVVTTSPSGARSFERYSYSVDPTGRLVSTLVSPAQGQIVNPTMHTIDDTVISPFSMTNSGWATPIRSYLPTVIDHLVCANGQTEAQCRATPAGRTRTVTAYETLADSSTPAIPVGVHALTTRVQLGLAQADGDRVSTDKVVVRSTASTYRVRPILAQRDVRVSGTPQMFAKTDYTWDANLNTPLTDEVWVDGNASNRAITRREYDSVGNVIKRWKPKQNAAGTTNLYSTYDSRKLFVATEIDEKAMQRDMTFHYGTGVRLTTAGPNVRGCTTNTTTCLLDATHPIKELEEVKIDALGRAIERWKTVSDDNSSNQGFYYTHTKLGTTTYVDGAVGSTPTSVETQALVIAGDTIWTRDKTEFDGHGRQIRHTSFVQGDAPVDAITTYHYRTDGTLADVNAPSPTTNDASTVQFTYTFDSLGRPTGTRRHDQTVLASRSGVDLSYDGLSSTTTEVVGASGGTPST
ncbi:MAG: hypothetical protein NT062_09160, partial [Proteobacteria bacterium]|nr:hypothetical protein [Pseudomonadota bacterium]